VTDSVVILADMTEEELMRILAKADRTLEAYRAAHPQESDSA